MSYLAEKEAALQKRVVPQTMKEDFEAFWTRSVAQLRAIPLEVKRTRIETPYDKSFTTYDLSFNTHDRTWVDAYFCVPNHASGKLPCVVQFHGNSEKRNIHAAIVATGVCCLSIDVRSQGGSTIDKAEYTSGDINGALITRGVEDKENFYWRNLYLDAVRAVDVAAAMEEVDPERIVTFGGSQGGALSVVASALSGRSARCYTNVTARCGLRQCVESGGGYSALTDYVKRNPDRADELFDMLTYFDINNMVSLLKVPTVFSIALSDSKSLPHLVYSAYTHATCEKSVMLWPFSPHGNNERWIRFAHGEFAKL